ncbi:hypothetical protein HDU76_000203 [Blyttiomyces sp. JEL0837]|nr:hypothetical protein HDU76_000203 [Blyttiomyces sp. JEL0837]
MATTLDKVKTKLLALQESLTSLVNAPVNLPWPEVLAQFNALISKYDSILHELQDPVIKQTSVYPQTLPIEDPDFLPRVLLKTKLIVDIEEAERALCQRYAERSIAAGNPLPPPTANRLDETALRNELRNWEYRVDAHEKIVSHAQNITETFADYNLKARLPDDTDEDEGGETQVEKPQSKHDLDLQKALQATLRFVNFGTTEPQYKDIV